MDNIEEQKETTGVTETEKTETEKTETEQTETVTSSPDTESQLTLQDFNKIETTQGTLKLNEQIFLELKTTNLYLNLILVAMVLCFLYYIISKALKKLFYINI